MISAKLTKKEKRSTHVDKNLPSDTCGRGRSPSTLVQHMLDLVRPPNLGQQPFGGRELLVRCTDLRFTVGWVQEGSGWLGAGSTGVPRPQVQQLPHLRPKPGSPRGPVRICQCIWAAPREDRLAPIERHCTKEAQASAPRLTESRQLDLHSSAAQSHANSPQRPNCPVQGSTSREMPLQGPGDHR